MYPQSQSTSPVAAYNEGASNGLFPTPAHRPSNHPNPFHKTGQYPVHTPTDWTRYWMERISRVLTQRNYAPATHRNYLAALKDFLSSHRISPSKLGPDTIGRYLLKCRTERNLEATTVNLILDAILFFYHHVIKAPPCVAGIPRMKEDQKLPPVPGAEKIKTLIDGTANGKHRLMLSLAYGCGLRVSELASLKLDAVDFERGIIKVRKGKGGKERLVMLPSTLVEEITQYRKQFGPITYLFESYTAGKPMSKRSLQAVFENGCEKAGIRHKGGIHSWKHSIATHLLEAGTDLRFIQALLGHSSSKTTERYTRVTARNIVRVVSPVDRLFAGA